MGVDIAKVALAAGNAVVATSRNTDAVAEAVGEADDLLIVKLDVTSRADAEAAAVERFGRIDVLVNNAGNFYAGYFEELTPEQIERQLATSLLGPMNVTRAVLPVMRMQRSGHIISRRQQPGDPAKLAQALVTIDSEEQPPLRFLANRRDRARGAEGRRSEGADRRLPRPVDVAHHRASPPGAGGR
jgi:hypothetical protein